MAKWTRNRVDPNSINGGNEYTKDDQVSVQNLNSVVNSGLYAQDFAEHLADSAEVVNDGGTTEVNFVDNLVDGKTYKKFQFKNIQGEKGETGEPAGFGTIGATITLLPSDSEPTVNVETSGTDESKNMQFNFGIPSYETEINEINNDINTLKEEIGKTEIIYDKNSNDPNINMGYTGGIPYNTTIAKDFSSYKLLIIYSISSFQNERVAPPLLLDTYNTGTYGTQGYSIGFSYSYQGRTYCLMTGAVVNKSKTELKNLSGRYRLEEFDYDELGCNITRIEGIRE